MSNIDLLTPRNHAGVPEGGGEQARCVRHHGAHGPRPEGQDGAEGRQAEAGRHAERAPGQVGHRLRQVGGKVRAGGLYDNVLFFRMFLCNKNNESF